MIVLAVDDGVVWALLRPPNLAQRPQRWVDSVPEVAYKQQVCDGDPPGLGVAVAGTIRGRGVRGLTLYGQDLPRDLGLGLLAQTYTVTDPDPHVSADEDALGQMPLENEPEGDLLLEPLHLVGESLAQGALLDFGQQVFEPRHAAMLSTPAAIKGGGNVYEVSTSPPQLRVRPTGRSPVKRPSP